MRHQKTSEQSSTPRERMSRLNSLASKSVPGLSLAESVAAALPFSRRREARLPFSGKVSLGVVSVRGTEAVEADIVDVSPSGLSVRVPRPLAMAARVYIETASEVMLGEVRHCRPDGEKHFIAGVLLLEIVKDSQTRSQLSSFWANFRRILKPGAKTA